MTSSGDQDLYAVRLLFEATHPDESASSEMWEERIVVVRARDESDAVHLARDLPGSERLEYKNKYGNRVVWAMVDVLDVKQLLDTAVNDGTEVYYLLHDRKSVDALRRSVEKRRK